MHLRHLLAKASLISICTSAVMSSAIAQDTRTLQPVLITANRYETKIDTVGSAVTIIERDEIERRKQPTVLELLRTVPGLSVVQTGGRGRTTSVFIRGAESDHTLVMIDGIRANDTTTGLYSFEDLKVNNIERIEIIRGPQSVLYGSEAIGGAINIITQKGTEGVHTMGSIEGGSHGTHQETFFLSTGNRTVDNATSISYYRTDGISAALANNGNPEHDSYENLSVSSRTGLNFWNNARADLSIRFSDGKTEIDDFSFDLIPIDDPNSTQKRDLLSGALVVSKPIANWFTPTVELGLTDNDTKGTDENTEFNNFTIDNRILSVTTKADIVPFSDDVVTLGYTYEQRKGENKGNFRRKRDINSFFLQNQYSWHKQYYLTTGLRHDNDSDFGDATTFRVTLAALNPTTGSRIHASLGTGFKAPTFNELFFPGFSNPDLKEETSLGYDVGVEQSFLNDALIIDITFFQNYIDDLIGFDTVTFIPNNIDETNTFGFETNLEAELFSLFQFALTYTYTESENEETGRILARRPRHHAAADIHFEPIDKLQSTITFLLVNSRVDSTDLKMDDYERVDLTLRYVHNNHIKPYIRIENLFDNDYEEIPGFGTTSFTMFGGVEVTL